MVLKFTENKNFYFLNQIYDNFSSLNFKYDTKVLKEVNKDLVINEIIKFNKDEKIHGILIDFPLPDSLKNNFHEIINHIDKKKDVECVNGYNYSKLICNDINVDLVTDDFLIVF